MKKRVASIVAIVLILVMSFPVISSAAGSDYLLKSSTSVDGYYSGNQNSYLMNTCGTPNAVIQNIYTALDTLPDVSNYSYYMILYNKSNANDMGTVSFIALNSDTSPYVINNYNTNQYFTGSTYWQQKNFTFCIYKSDNNPLGKAFTYTLNQPNSGWSTTTLDKYGYFSNMNDGYWLQSSYTTGVVVDCNVPVLCNLDIGSLSNTSLTYNDYKTIYSSSDTYTNYCPNDLPYVDSSGNIITPGPVEPVIDKSIAFRKIDLSTIYSYTAKAHCAGLLAWEIDPVGYSIIDDNLAGWTMHYNITVNYKWTTAMDTWIYQPFYSGGAASGSVVWDIDIAPTGSIKANEQVIDIYDLLNTYPISRGNAQNINDVALAVYALKNGKGSVWGDVFGQSGSDISNIASEISSKNLFSVNGYSSSQINSIFNPTYSYALTNLDLQVVCYPVNNTAHIKGKSGTTKLNLVTNTSSSYAQGAEVTDENTGTDVISPDYNNNTDDVVQPVSSNGSIVYVVINNPLNGTSGGGSSCSSSSSSPSINVDVGGGTLSFDPGYEDLKNDIIAQDNNWATYFDPFVDEENGAGELTGTVLTYLPSEMKTIFISGFGVLTLLAIYRYIRRG